MSLPPPPPGMDITESAVPGIVAGMAVTRTLSYSAVVLRFIARRKGGTGYWWDDWLILAAALALISCLVEEILEFGTGTGRHIWWVVENHPNWLETDQPRYIYADQKNYPVIIGCIKLSILSLYVRLFGVNKKMAIVCYVQMAMVLVWGIVTEFLFIFQCTPISAALSETRAGGTCFEFSKLFLGTNIVNVIMDFGILVTPLHPIWSLQLPRRKKFFVTAILLLGGGESIFSILRVVKLSALSFIDATWDNGAAVIWSDVEADVGVLCACIPVLGSLLPQHWLGTMNGSSKIYASGTSLPRSRASYANMGSGNHGAGWSKSKPTPGSESPRTDDDDHELGYYTGPEIKRTTEVTIENEARLKTPTKNRDEARWSSTYGIAR